MKLVKKKNLKHGIDRIQDGQNTSYCIIQIFKIMLIHSLYKINNNKKNVRNKITVENYYKLFFLQLVLKC